MGNLDYFLSDISKRYDVDLYVVEEDCFGNFEYFIYQGGEYHDLLMFSILVDEDYGYILSLYENIGYEVDDVKEIAHSHNAKNIYKKIEDCFKKE